MLELWRNWNNLLTRQLDYATDLFPKITGAFLFRTFGGFFHLPTTQIYCLTGAIISEKRTTNTYLKYNAQSSTVPGLKFEGS